MSATARAALDARCEDLCEDVQRHLADVSVLMREDGFRHGAQFDECTCVCLLAALLAQAAETRAECEKDAARFRALRTVLEKSVGGFVEVNDAALVYEKSEAGKEVEIRWYPNTPIGFESVSGATLDEAVDALVSALAPVAPEAGKEGGE